MPPISFGTDSWTSTEPSDAREWPLRPPVAVAVAVYRGLIPIGCVPCATPATPAGDHDTVPRTRADCDSAEGLASVVVDERVHVIGLRAQREHVAEVQTEVLRDRIRGDRI